MSRYNLLSFITGFVSILSQVILIRETLSSFSGNELILSVVFGAWLVCGGIGAFSARRIRIHSEGLLFYSLIISTLLLPFQISYLRYLHGVIIMSGLPSIEFILLHSFITVLPSSFLFGALFAFISAQLSNSSGVSKLYVYECAGATLGSLLYVLFLLTGINSLTLSLLIILIANLFIIFTTNVKLLKSISIGLTVLSLISILSNIETKSLELAFPGQEIISEKQSPYGTIVVTSVSNQTNLYENGMLLTAAGEPISREELSHFVMIQRPDAKRVLIIGGGYSGIIEELKKYKAEQIDYLDIDPALVKITESFYPDFLSSAKTHLEDARKFLKHQKNKYDVILISSPLPLSGSLNRFYTYEFFTELKKNLNPDGVLGFGLAGSETYMGRELRKLHSSIYRALRQVFKEILILPGQKTFYIASDGLLTENILEKLRELKINTQYVNEAYLRGRFTEEKLSQVKKWVMAESKINRDLSPSAFRYYLDLWLKQFSTSKNFILLSGIFLLFISLFIILNSKNPVSSTVSFTSGFTCLSLEITLLLIFQVLYSTLYLDVGILFSACMLGMSLGGFITKILKKRRVILVLSEFIITLFPFCIAILISTIDLHSMPLYFARMVFFLFLFLSGLFTGTQFYQLFPYASENAIESASGIYSADLLGSCAGALLTGIFLIPAYGAVKSLILLTLIKTISAFFLSASLSDSKLIIPYRQWQMWAAMFAVILLTGWLIINNNMPIYSFSKSNVQALLFLGSILFAILLSTGWVRVVFTNWLKLTQFLLVSLVAFYPVFRCFFKIPYLFCHVCPRQCVFGMYRKYIILASTITNAGNWPFCHMTCPIGIMYDSQPLSERRISYSVIKKFHLIRYVILILVPFVYLKAKFDEASLTPPLLDIYTFMFKNEFSVSIPIISISAFFILGGFVIPRFFCNLLCPVGAIKKLIEKSETFRLQKK